MPDLDELLTLTPPDDLPDDALVEITAADLRALVRLIPGARAVQPDKPTRTGRISRDEQDAACQLWLSLHARPRQSPNSAAYAYLLKHEVERWHGAIYIPETVFTEMAVNLGYKLAFRDGQTIFRMGLRRRARNMISRFGETHFIPWDEKK